MSFEAGSTYIGWQLIDVLTLTGETATAIPGPPPAMALGTTSAFSSAPISIYNDVASDANQQLLNNTKASLNDVNSRFDMEVTRKDLPSIDKEISFRHGTTQGKNDLKPAH